MKNALCFICVAYAIVILMVLFYFMKIFLMPKLRKKFLHYKTEKVQVPVLRTEFVPERISKVSLYRTLRVRVLPKEYNVYYVYAYNNHVFNNKELYDRVMAGEKTFEIIVHKGYNKNGKLKHVYYTIAWN